MIRFDFSATDPGIELDAWEWDYSETQLLCALVPEECGGGWFQDSTLPAVEIIFTGAEESPLLSIFLPAGGSILLCTLGITLPSDFFGGVTLDALNLPDDNSGDGARVDVGFDPPISIREFGGGSITFVPEPATLILLIIGAAGVAFRRARRDAPIQFTGRRS